MEAPAFNGCCAVYAPSYRQANGTAFTTPTPDGDRAVDLAYQDVRAAFAAFLARRGADRPFVLAGHSQGARLAERLLYEEIAGTPLRAHLVVAVLPGAALPLATLRAEAPDVPPCVSPSQTGCVVAWNARGPAYVPGAFEMRRDGPPLCTNPLSWRIDGSHVPRSANLGAVFLESDDPAPRPGFADAQCVDGTLIVREMGAAPRDVMSRLLDHVLGAGNYHPIELQLFFVDLRENVEGRVAAMWEGG